MTLRKTRLKGQKTGFKGQHPPAHASFLSPLAAAQPVRAAWHLRAEQTLQIPQAGGIRP
jgi:hypothetical protein